MNYQVTATQAVTLSTSMTSTLQVNGCDIHGLPISQQNKTVWSFNKDAYFTQVKHQLFQHTFIGKIAVNSIVRNMQMVMKKNVAVVTIKTIFGIEICSTKKRVVITRPTGTTFSLPCHMDNFDGWMWQEVDYTYEMEQELATAVGSSTRQSLFIHDMNHSVSHVPTTVKVEVL